MTFFIQLITLSLGQMISAKSEDSLMQWYVLMTARLDLLYEYKLQLLRKGYYTDVDKIL